MTAAIRLVLSLLVLVLLGRAARVAWRNRRMATNVWRRIRPYHVAGSVVLGVAVLGTVTGLMTAVPVSSRGLGDLVGLTGNLVFAPVEELTARTAPPISAETNDPSLTGGGVPAWVATAGIGVFLVGLIGLFPWLAYVEERTFRQGLEDVGLGREIWTALRFGLTHLIMLIPLAAALAIAIAGFFYGRVYRRAYRRAHSEAMAAATAAAVAPPGAPQGTAPGPPLILPPSPAYLRQQAVLASTVWHTTFNTLIVVLVLLAALFGGL